MVDQPTLYEQWLGLLRDDKGRLLPPWKALRHVAPMSIGWRMGPGEAYIEEWHREFARLSSQQQRAYRRSHHAPLHWFWFYYAWDGESLVGMGVGCLVMLAAFLTFPLRYPCWLLYRYCFAPTTPPFPETDVS